MDQLFFKVFRNSYLRNLILSLIQNQNYLYLGNKRPFTEIKSLKWMIKQREYGLLVDKLESNQEIIIDYESVIL
ncbi:hypothetical protein DICPUDRAFT_36894, partial [Dictyostelium purpureum]